VVTALHVPAAWNDGRNPFPAQTQILSAFGLGLAGIVATRHKEQLDEHE
jgi:hypothetical protein